MHPLTPNLLNSNITNQFIVPFRSINVVRHSKPSHSYTIFLPTFVRLTLYSYSKPTQTLHTIHTIHPQLLYHNRSLKFQPARNCALYVVSNKQALMYSFSSKVLNCAKCSISVQLSVIINNFPIPLTINIAALYICSCLNILIEPPLMMNACAVSISFFLLLFSETTRTLSGRFRFFAALPFVLILSNVLTFICIMLY